MVDAYGINIDVPWLWEQMKTFVEKDLKSSTSHRQTRYQAADTRYDYDDAIFAITFAYINAQAHSRYEPENIRNEDKNTHVVIRYVQCKETNFRMKRARVDSRTGKILKVLD
jgi:outer membrane cobalamin receptor